MSQDAMPQGSAGQRPLGLTLAGHAPYCLWPDAHPADHGDYCTRDTGACVRGYTPDGTAAEQAIDIACSAAYLIQAAPGQEPVANRYRRDVVQVRIVIGDGRDEILVDLPASAARSLGAAAIAAADVAEHLR